MPPGGEDKYLLMSQLLQSRMEITLLQDSHVHDWSAWTLCSFNAPYEYSEENNKLWHDTDWFTGEKMFYVKDLWKKCQAIKNVFRRPTIIDQNLVYAMYRLKTNNDKNKITFEWNTPLQDSQYFSWHSPQ